MFGLVDARVELIDGTTSGRIGLLGFSEQNSPPNFSDLGTVERWPNRNICLSMAGLGLFKSACSFIVLA